MMTFHIAPWVLPILGSALMLGIYDITKKQAVKDNSVLPVLFWATMIGSIFFLLLTLIRGNFVSCFMQYETAFFPVLLKSVIVGSSWICIYYAMRELPISIGAPIGATSPLWVFIGGFFLYHEVPNLWQGIAMFLIFAGYYLFSILGKLEGFSLKNLKGIPLILLGTIITACSALYDKYLLGVIRIPPDTVQFWFSIDIIFVLGLAVLIRQKNFGERHTFRWTLAIPLTGVLMALADICYFYAVSLPDTPISMLSLLRRSNCIVAFVAGSIWFHERNQWKKAVALVLVLLGVAMLTLFK
jgi:transporter family protein